MALPARWRAFAVALAVAGSALIGPAEAFELFGVRLFGKEPEPLPGSVPYTVEFTAEGAERALARRLAGASRLIEEEDEPSPGDAALLATARGDYRRILGALYAAGRYGGVISITIDGREAADLPIDTEFGETAAVAITVEPGPLYLFDDVAIANRPGPILDDPEVPPTPEELGLRPGEPALSGVVLASEAALIGRWREKGHPKAAIERRTASAYHEEEAIDVAITVAPGRPAVFGPTTVSGTERMDPEFVAYYADIEPGTAFDPDELQEARDQLRRLEVFQALRLVEADEIGADGTLPIDIAVAERPLRVFGVGAKYSTVDGAALEAYWRHRNLFGRAEKLRLEARVGGINAQNPDEYNYRVAASFLKPGIFTPYTDLKATVFAEQLAPDTFRARTVGSRIGFAHRATKRLTVETFAQVEASTIDQTTVGDGDFLLFSLRNEANYDGTDSLIDPTRGFRVGVIAEPFYEAGFGNPGIVTGLNGSVYRGFGEDDRVVLAARAAVASIAGPPLDEVPANRLFYAGGGGSIRGYPYRGVGPINAAGKVIGGRSSFVGSVEARVKVTDKIGIVPFADFGNAFRNELPDFSEPLRVGVGIGARYYTTLGPLRFDVAVPLDPIQGDPNVAFYIGLGQAF